MTSTDLSQEEYFKLEEVDIEHKKQLYIWLFAGITPLLLFFIPMKYLPFDTSSLQSINGKTNLATYIGMTYFKWVTLIWPGIVILTGLDNHKILPIKKDLINATKLQLKGEVVSILSYDKKYTAIIKNVKNLKVLRFDESNYTPLKEGDVLAFDVFEYSKILIKITAINPRIEHQKITKKPMTINEVTDTCPACKQKLNAKDLVCPECGLHFE